MAEASYDLTRSRAATFNWRIVAIAAFTVLVVALAALLHIIPYGRAVWDFVFVLDGAYRIGLGQIPHVDFASPIGALTLYLAYLAERIFPGGQPFVGMHALAWLMMVPPFAVIASRIRSGWGFTQASPFSRWWFSCRTRSTPPCFPRSAILRRTTASPPRSCSWQACGMCCQRPVATACCWAIC